MSALENVVLTPKAFEQWKRVCREAVNSVPANALKLNEIGEEQAHPQDNGSLLITCRFDQGSVNLLLPPEDWSWAN